MTNPNSQPAPGRRAGRQQPSPQAKAQALHTLQQQVAATQQPHDWAADPIWDEPIPEPPDWDTLSGHQQHVYKLAAIAYAVRAVADDRAISAAALLSDWEVL